MIMASACIETKDFASSFFLLKNFSPLVRAILFLSPERLQNLDQLKKPNLLGRILEAAVWIESTPSQK